MYENENGNETLAPLRYFDLYSVCSVRLRLACVLRLPIFSP